MDVRRRAVAPALAVLRELRVRERLARLVRDLAREEVRRVFAEKVEDLREPPTQAV